MIEKPTEQELDKLWLDMSFLKDYLINKEVYRKLTDSYHTLNKGIDELIEKYNEIFDNIPRISIHDSLELMRSNNHTKYILIELIQDLKSLKGE